MDEIEKGFDLIFEQIEELEAGKEERAKQILEGKEKLLERMAEKSAPIVARVGMNMVKRGSLTIQSTTRRRCSFSGRPSPPSSGPTT
jgi:hypothetical protein